MHRPLVVGLALLAALCAAVGIVIRQRATEKVPAEQEMSTAIVATLSRNPWWWAGTLVAIVGYVCQALALSKGSLLLVQPLLVTSLLFALPISAALSHRRIAPSDWGWAGLLTLGLAVFVVVGQPREGHYRPPVPAWALVVTIFVPLVGVCVALAARAAGRHRAVLLAVAVAVLFATVAVLTKISMHRLTVGGLKALLVIPAPYLVLVLAVAAMVLQQWAFHAGELQTSVPTMLVLEPLVAVLLGVIVLGEHLAVTGPAAWVLPLAVVAMVAATIALARGSAAHEEQLGAWAAAPESAIPNTG
jgi:drug/metabolite transporter (DMT)-like permease